MKLFEKIIGILIFAGIFYLTYWIGGWVLAAAFAYGSIMLALSEIG